MESVIQYLDQFSDSELILSFGNNQCGKSTMLNSLLLGPHALNDKLNENGQTVIEVREEFNHERHFSINHSLKKSDTIMP